VAGAATLINPEDGEGALTLAARAAELVAGAEPYEPALAPVSAELRDAALRLQEAAVELRAQLDGLDGDPGRLEQVEARLQLFHDLERRFGGSLEELVDRCREAQSALELIDGGGRRLAELEGDLAEAHEQATRCARALRTARTDAAAPFARAVEAELVDLGMEGAALQVAIEDAELGIRGGDRVTLLLAANAGLPAGPIASVASGGELSRIALAVRVVARSGGGPGTLLLDEVDAGVGGRTAHAVADKLKRLAADAQLICITHLPQIAGAADGHFRVEKAPGDPASTTVALLEGEQIVDEVARMLGAERGDETARRHAATLLG
jgi:DNA repair protein RecN (Recombination protein N)